MSTEVIERATEPFFTTKGAGKGTGLGLAMVHAYIRQSGGAMQIESRLGVGTSFHLYLPVAPSAAVAQDLAAPAAPLRAVHPSHILLVDDDESVRGVTAAMLDDLGHQVSIVPDAETALDRLRQDTTIRLVLSDIAMPGMDGRALAIEIRKTWPSLPVLLFSGNADTSEQDGAQVLGKPFSYEGLGRRIDELLASTTILDERGGRDE
jgi:CheY-like chemotaxis protein